MARALSGTSQAEFTKAIGSMIRDMDLDLKNLAMGIVILASIFLARSMGRAVINGHLDSYMKALGSREKNMALVIGQERMEIAIQDSGNRIIPMDMENIHGRMAIFMKENGI